MSGRTGRPLFTFILVPLTNRELLHFTNRYGGNHEHFRGQKQAFTSYSKISAPETFSDYLLSLSVKVSSHACIPFLHKILIFSCLIRWKAGAEFKTRFDCLTAIAGSIEFLTKELSPYTRKAVNELKRSPLNFHVPKVSRNSSW